MTDYTAILPTGKENAIPSAELASRQGLSIRAMRKDIARSRRAGQIILSSRTGGYYLPATADEAREFVGMMYRSARSMFKTAKYARKYLKNIDGQMSIEEAETL